MGLKYKDKVKDSIKNKKSDSDKESDEDHLKRISPLDYRKEREEEKQKRMSTWDSKDLKSKENDIGNKITQGTSKEKKETKWDRIDCSKDYSFEEKKIEGYKNDNIDDNMMTGEDYNEKIKDFSFNEKKSDKNDDDLSWLKNFDENFSNNEYNKKDYEGINKFSEYDKEDDLSRLNDFEENISKDKNDLQKDFVEDIDDNIKDKELNKNFIEDGEDNKLENLSKKEDYAENSGDKDISEKLKETQQDHNFINKFIEGINEKKELLDKTKDLIIEDDDTSKLESYEKIALKAIEKGFITFNPAERDNYENKVAEFLDYYKKHYQNTFSEDFQKITNINIIRNNNDLRNEIKSIIESELNQKSGDTNVFFLYRIVNKEKQLVRIGKTGDCTHRLVGYLSRAFTEGKTREKVTNFHLDIRSLGVRKEFNNKFEYQILCVSNNLESIKSLERLFTIYENKCNNKIGFDLSINNYYNKIVGDLYDYIDGEFQKHHPNWREIPPDRLETAIKTHHKWDDILKNIQDVDSITTIMKRAVSYGFTIKGTGSAQDIRAYFMKPIIEDCILKNYNPAQIPELLVKKGFTFLNQLSNTQRARSEWLRKTCNYIWKDEMQQIGYAKATSFRVRKLLLYNELLKVAHNPSFNTFYKAEEELRKNGIELKPPNLPESRGELYSLMKQLPFKDQFSYKQEQNKILTPQFAELLRYEGPQLSVGDIAKKFGLDRSKDKNLIINMINRIFQNYVSHSRSVNEIRNFLQKSKKRFDI